MQSNDGTLRYLPVMSKLKLNKKRKAHADDEEQVHSQVQHIVIAERGLSSDDARMIQSNLSLMSNRALKVQDIAFENKQQLQDVERQVATQLKALFKVRSEDEPMAESEDDLFGGKSPAVEEAKAQRDSKEAKPDVEVEEAGKESEADIAQESAKPSAEISEDDIF